MKNKKNIAIYPMMPRKYTWYQRKKLRDFEKQLLKDVKLKEIFNTVILLLR